MDSDDHDHNDHDHDHDYDDNDNDHDDHDHDGGWRRMPVRGRRRRLLPNAFRWRRTDKWQWRTDAGEGALSPVLVRRCPGRRPMTTDDDERGGWEPDEDRRQHAAVLVFTHD